MLGVLAAPGTTAELALPGVLGVLVVLGELVVLALPGVLAAPGTTSLSSLQEMPHKY